MISTTEHYYLNVEGETATSRTAPTVGCSARVSLSQTHGYDAHFFQGCVGIDGVTRNVF